MRLPGPRTMNQYEPMKMTKNMSRARPNSKYSVVRAGPTTTVMITIAVKIAMAIVPVVITVFIMIGPSLAAPS
jgi:hypothetical protein